MPLYTKESLETLRQRIDLVDVLSGHIELKGAGSAYKALCPFHDEKTPSFSIQRGDSHYHCFGCGAHGDAIAFLMDYQKLTFTQAVESLAERFHVHLEQVEQSHKDQGPPTAKIKEALDVASRFYQFILLHTPEGHEALHYLYERGIDLDFIKKFGIGLAPKAPGVFRKAMHSKGIKDDIMAAAGLIKEARNGGWRDFFYDRITFPIHQASGAVIGFSARKYKEETFGGKYINTPETPVFKKSRVLFGIQHCRRRIAKEQRAIIVEGQIDALRLIHMGLNLTVAGQGTAFGEGHVAELTQLGVREVYLALDNDSAGQEAACKIGNLFQKEGVEVKVITLPPGSDPDAFVQENGIEPFLELLKKGQEYLPFLVDYRARFLDLESPAGKNSLVREIAQQIRTWDHPLMVHESLRKLAHLARVPEDVVKIEQYESNNLYIKKSGNVGKQTIDPNQILEEDLLRWLLVMGESRPDFLTLAQTNLTPEDLRVAACRLIYQTLLEKSDATKLLDLAIEVDDAEAQQVISQILHKKIDRDKADEYLERTIQKILDRNWMEQREAVKMKIQSGQCSDDEVLDLVKAFDTLRASHPLLKKIEVEEACT